MKRINLFLVFGLFAASINAQKIMGFTDANAARQIDWEKQFDAQLKTSNLDEWMKFLSSHPHHVGSPQDKANAEYIAALFRSWGYQTEIAVYYPLFPTPKSRLLELVNEGPFKIVSTAGDDADQYGRKLRRLMRNGLSLGEFLIDEGLARRYAGGRRSWCL